MITPQLIGQFQEKIWDFYAKNRRDFAWRINPTPYWVFVSEIMLQQTQTFRVSDKFESFIARFPSFEALAKAPFVEVLAEWKGLGYNRRALFMHKAAQAIVEKHNGQLPDSPEVLVQLPGIGPATSCSLVAFAFNRPTIFIETNIRAVFIHEFFSSRSDKIHDNELMPLIKAAVPQNEGRDWYYALMDYGVFLKKTYKNPSRKSKHHTIQSKFEGSDRQIRGKILEYLLAHKYGSSTNLALFCATTPERLFPILDEMCQQGLIIKADDSFQIA